MTIRSVLLGCSIFLCYSLLAQTDEQKILEKLASKADNYAGIADQIWNWAEMGYLEEKSSGLLQKTLHDAGFNI